MAAEDPRSVEEPEMPPLCTKMAWALLAARFELVTLLRQVSLRSGTPEVVILKGLELTIGAIERVLGEFAATYPRQIKDMPLPPELRH